MTLHVKIKLSEKKLSQMKKTEVQRVKEKKEGKKEEIDLGQYLTGF